eukprot:6202032-Pleurochrysis_carterae.AAC.2
MACRFSRGRPGWEVVRRQERQYRLASLDLRETSLPAPIWTAAQIFYLANSACWPGHPLALPSPRKVCRCVVPCNEKIFVFARCQLLKMGTWIAGLHLECATGSVNRPSTNIIECSLFPSLMQISFSCQLSFKYQPKGSGNQILCPSTPAGCGSKQKTC